jgi:hypothetical protein
MTQTSFFDYLQPLLVCHALPGLLGGLLRWFYEMRSGQYKGSSPRRRLAMLSDIFGGLLAGTLMGPWLSRFFPVPDQTVSVLEAIQHLSPWFTGRWLFSAMLGFFWLAALDTAKEKVTSLVRKGIDSSGHQTTGKPAKKMPGRPAKKQSAALQRKEEDDDAQSSLSDGAHRPDA